MNDRETVEWIVEWRPGALGLRLREFYLELLSNGK